MRNSTSLSDFKKNLRDKKENHPSIFILGTGQPKYTTRDYDLSVALLIVIYLKKNLIDSPRCSCGQIETVKHYLCDCTNYTQLRHKALSDVLHLPINDLISGNSNLSIEENETVFDFVQTFITLTGRFTRVPT